MIKNCYLIIRIQYYKVNNNNSRNKNIEKDLKIQMISKQYIQIKKIVVMKIQKADIIKKAVVIAVTIMIICK